MVNCDLDIFSMKFTPKLILDQLNGTSPLLFLNCALLVNHAVSFLFLSLSPTDHPVCKTGSSIIPWAFVWSITGSH